MAELYVRCSAKRDCTEKMSHGYDRLFFTVLSNLVVTAAFLAAYPAHKAVYIITPFGTYEQFSQCHNSVLWYK